MQKYDLKDSRKKIYRVNIIALYTSSSKALVLVSAIILITG